MHAVRRLEAARTVDRVIVATDSEEVASVVGRAGREAVLVDAPCQTGSDRVAAVALELEHDICVNLQADQPIISPGDVDAAVMLLRTDTSFDLTTLAFRTEDEAAYSNPNVVKVVTGKSARALYFSRAPIPWAAAPGGSGWYLHHVGLYCFRPEALRRFASLERSPLEILESLEQLRALENGMSVGVAITSNETWSVDRPDDLMEVERRLAADD